MQKLGTEHAELINDNWKFSDAYSVQWIRAQCASGLAYGVFVAQTASQSSQEDKKASPAQTASEAEEQGH